ncbi:hypothetical protein J5Y04_39815 [Kitasatospora sp. RG8]|nr:hypothetical protein [Kitasatospora sp. RG8]
MEQAGDPAPAGSPALSRPAPPRSDRLQLRDLLVPAEPARRATVPGHVGDADPGAATAADLGGDPLDLLDLLDREAAEALPRVSAAMSRRQRPERG